MYLFAQQPIALTSLADHPVRLTIGAVCLALALILLVLKVIVTVADAVRGDNRPVRDGNGRPSRRRIHTAERQTFGFGLFSRHSRPSHSRRRYGKGYQPPQRERRGRHRKFASAQEETLPERMARIEAMEDIDEVLGFVTPATKVNATEEDSPTIPFTPIKPE